MRAMGTLAIVVLAAPCSFAQATGQTTLSEQTPTKASASPNTLSLTTDENGIQVGTARSVDLGHWGVQTDFGYIGDPTRPQSHGIPNWQLGVRASRELGRLHLGVAASIARGHPGPVFLSQELGTSRDLSVDTPLTGPHSYRTALDTIVNVGIPVASLGRVKVKAVSEVWNPFSRSNPGGLTGSVLPSRALRAGLVITF
jgi:hypothetical protein